MLLPDSFLRQVPHALEPKARLILDAAGWAIDSILISFTDLETIARGIPFDQRSEELDHRLFVHCWSIVDQCHILRCLLQRLPPTAEKDIEEFIVKTERYTLVRNSMDHLFNMIDNLIKTEQSKPPIFGALSWIRVDPENMIEGKLVGYTACNVSTGAVLRKPEWTVFNAPDSENIHGPVSSFKFEALDHFVDLTALMADIRALLAHFENIVRPRVEASIRAGAKLKGIDAEELLKLRGGGGLKVA